MTNRVASRERIVAEALRLGRVQLAEVGAAALSLRAVARELGVVSSAVYRYFPSREALLTALIIEAYDELGESAERAERVVPRSDLLRRFRVTAHAVRNWALANPNEYALIFGSPVPGYAAPEDTIAHAARVPLVLLGILRDFPPDHVGFDLGSPAARAIEPLHSGLAPDVAPNLLALGYTAWHLIIGAVSMETFGHQRNVIAPAGRTRAGFFDSQLRLIAADLGMPRG